VGVSSYISPKASRGARSDIEGRGLFALEPIAKGEIIAVKGGHIVDAATLEANKEVVGNSDIQIADGLYLAALSPDEYEDVMLYLNHSCAPNAGVRGNVIFVTMRDVAAGEELTIDYAMIDDFDGEMTCRCGASSCRGVVSGKDWQRPELQQRYAGYFSWYLAAKMHPTLD
jgi:SET domain-containing protein